MASIMVVFSGMLNMRTATLAISFTSILGSSTTPFGALSQMSEPALSAVFRDAAGQGKLAEVQRTLRQGVNVNAVDEDGNTALHRAADKGHMEVVTALLAAGADTNLQDKLGRTALHWAAYYGRIEMVTALLAAGADIKLKNGSGCTALHIAAWRDADWETDKGQNGVVTALLAAGRMAPTPT